jgi:hypothetical protein
VQVRQGSITASFNGQQYASWKTNLTGLQLGEIRPKIPGHLGLATAGVATFFEVKLTDRTKH